MENLNGNLEGMESGGLESHSSLIANPLTVDDFNHSSSLFAGSEASIPLLNGNEGLIHHTSPTLSLASHSNSSQNVAVVDHQIPHVDSSALGQLNSQVITNTDSVTISNETMQFNVQIPAQLISNLVESHEPLNTNPLNPSIMSLKDDINQMTSSSPQLNRLSINSPKEDEKKKKKKAKKEVSEDSSDEESLDQEGKKKAQRVSKACLNCQKAHVSCGSERPCKRCIERGFPNKCEDGVAKKRGRKRIYPVDAPRDRRKKQPPITTDSSSPIDSPSSLRKSSPKVQNQQQHNEQQAINDAFNTSTPLDFVFPGTQAINNQVLMEGMPQFYQQQQSLLTSNIHAPFPPNTNRPQQQQPTAQQQQQQQPQSSQMVHPLPLGGERLNSLVPNPTQPFTQPFNNTGPNVQYPRRDSTMGMLPLSLQTQDGYLFSHLFFSPMKEIEEPKAEEQNAIQEVNPNEHPEKPPSLFSKPSFYKNLFSLLRSKGFDPPVQSFIENGLTAAVNRVTTIRSTLSTEDSDCMQRDFDLFLNMFKQSFDHLATPTIIWERSLVIHYVNQAFFDLNGFPYKIPTDSNDFALIHALSSATLKNYYIILAQDFFNVSVNSMLVSAGIRDFRVLDREKYVEGILCITIKRDMIGLPLIFVGNFLPLAGHNIQ